MHLQEAKKRVEQLMGDRKMIPCTPEEVERLEQWKGHRLPEAYREILLWMGRWGGGLLRGSECFYGDLRYIQSEARELLAENQFPEALPEDAFVFFMHQGCQFNFFRLDEGDDPPVYRYLEGTEQISFRLIYAHFSEFVMAEINQHIAIEQESARLQEKVAQINPEQARRMQAFQRRLRSYDDNPEVL